MKKEINWINHINRNYLKEILPLNTPLKVEIEPTSACNFKCIYCRHSSVNIKPEFMTMEIFNKIYNGVKKFNKRIKSFNFAGIGEPLLNKNIYEMIKKANELSEDTVLITNGSLLNKENSDKLIESNIKTVRISLQGVDKNDYYKISNYNIDFQKFLDNLEYFYKNKKEGTKLFLKMPDIAIKTDEKRNKFYKLFEDKCDFLTIQNICDFFSEVDYSNMELNDKNILGNDSKEILVCHFPFYSIYVDKSGIVFPCCHIYGDLDIGDINKESLFDIWNGKKLYDFRIDLLTKHTINMSVCSTCTNAKSYTNQYDYLDDSIDDLLNKYKR
ncbi:radical SAM/SPASM domain-containing protein [Brachyspira hyodysenteriae]|uniref:radical SAM/SPASM domain-containing protein n=1 Tax=Brachyspira hyodysenteriae TaxID=159 RepID=UPI000A15C18B|nr:radical SAM/SPASM domain-containing protein [Brachyspira hyodysenteriae]